MNLSKDNGVIENIVKQEFVEYFPFSQIADSKRKNDFINEDDFLIARIVEETRFERSQGGKVIATNKSEKTNPWKLIHKERLRRYNLAGESFYQPLQNGDPEDFENEKIRFISTDNLEEIEKTGYHNVSEKDGAYFQVDPQDFKDKGKSFCLVKEIRKNYHSNEKFFQISKNKVFANPINIDYFSFTSENWNLEQVLEAIIKSPNILFFKERFSSLNLIDKNNAKDVESIVSYIPYYKYKNSKVKCIRAMFVPSAEHIDEMLRKNSKNYDNRFNWVKNFLPKEISLKDAKECFFEEEILLAILPDSLQHSKKYQEFLKTNVLDENKQELTECSISAK